MKNQELFFSIIIPTRNRPNDFKTALDSVLAQVYTNFEVIVVNDGTSAEYYEDYNKIERETPDKVQFIKLIERSRGHGHCFARNQGADKAKGKYICFLDDDDWWIDNTFLERAADEITNYNADFYFANQKAITQDNTHIKNVWVENLPEKLPKNDPRLKQTVFPVSIEELLLATGFPHMNCWAISTQLYFKIGGMDENLRYEPDRDIYLRALDKATCILYDQTTTALHNVPDKSKSSNASTLTNLLEKLLFQQRTADKGILLLKNKTLIQHCKTRKGYIIKKITMELYKQKKFKSSFYYALQALAILPTIKWLGQTSIIATQFLYTTIKKTEYKG